MSHHLPVDSQLEQSLGLLPGRAETSPPQREVVHLGGQGFGGERVGNGQCFSFKRLKSDLLGEHDIAFHELAFRKEAQTPDALSFLVEFFHVHAPAKRMR